MKYIFYSLLGLCTSFQVTFAEMSRDALKSGIIPDNSGDILSEGTGSESGEGLLDAILAFARDSIFGFMALIAIGMFLFIGGRLVIARGNPEEFKKALTSFVYAAVGIFTVAAALAVVRFVAGINL